MSRPLSTSRSPLRRCRLERLEDRRLLDGAGLAAPEETPWQADVGSPWHNAAKPGDVNFDGHISPIDALALINIYNSDPDAHLRSLELLARERANAGERQIRPMFPDVSGDSLLSPLDALLVINALNKPDESLRGPSSVDAPDTAGDLQTSDAIELDFEGGVATGFGFITSEGERDVFELTVANDGRLAISGFGFGSEMPLEITVYNETDGPLIQVSSLARGRWTAPFEFDVSPGVYQVSVTSPGDQGLGEYMLDVFQIGAGIDFMGAWVAADVAADHTWGVDVHVNSLDPNATQIHFGAGGTAMARSYIDAPGDNDVYQVRFDNDGTLLVTGFGLGLGMLDVQVFDERAALLAELKPDGLWLDTLAMDVAAGTYFIKVGALSDSQDGEYLLAVDQVYSEPDDSSSMWALLPSPFPPDAVGICQIGVPSPCNAPEYWGPFSWELYYELLAAWGGGNDTITVVF